MRHVELNDKETALWDENCLKARQLRQFKRAIGRLIWQDCKTDVAVVTTTKKIVWSLLDKGKQVVMTQTFKDKTHVVLYDKFGPGGVALRENKIMRAGFRYPV